MTAGRPGSSRRTRRFPALAYAGKPEGSDNGGDPGGGGGSQIKTVVATGPGGAAWTPDEGDMWLLLEGVENYRAVAFANAQAGWFVGTDGRILKIGF